MDPICMQYDDVAWERSEEVFEAFKDRLCQPGVLRSIGDLILQHQRGTAVILRAPTCGSFNVCITLEYSSQRSTLIRLPIAGQSMLPEEKLRNEVAAMRFIADKTSIPLPFVVYRSRTPNESPAGLGPFMITEYVNHSDSLCRALDYPDRPKDARPRLYPDIEQEKLAFCYKEMAYVVLQLSRPSLPQIGAISEVDEFEWAVTERPLTYNMNALLQLGQLPFDRLPVTTFSTASSYYHALADIHLYHLETQHNDAILSENDCRRKYVARHLFRKLASENRLDHFPQFDKGPFKLYCEDLRPSNVLATEHNTIAAVVDWEYTTAAPVGFTFSPPWWLLLEHPTKWPWGLDDWETHYAGRLETFLEVLQEVEQDAIEKKFIRPDEILSSRMRESWNSGAFWVEYAAQRSFAFDHIFFNRLDRKFFGEIKEGEDWLACRLPLLTEEQRQNMEPFVQKKMKEMETRILVDERFDALDLPPLLDAHADGTT